MTAAPTTRREIAGRLNEIAPFPAEDTPDHARAMAKYLAVSAQRRWKWNLDIVAADGMSLSNGEYRNSVHAMMAEFAALHLLLTLLKQAPELAEQVSRQIHASWNDGGEIGEWLWQFGMSLGIDMDEVSHLEAAWWAAPREVQEKR